MDSFGHYNSADFPAKYVRVGDNGIVVNSTIARTGTRCLQIVSGADGPVLDFRPTQYIRLIAQGAWNVDTPGVGQQFNTFSFDIATHGYNIRIRVNGDSSLSVWRGNPNDAGSVELQRSSFRPFKWNTWNWISADCTFSDTLGSVVVNCNGRVVANVSGVRTTGVLGLEFCDAFEVMGTPTNGPLCYVADFALIDPSGGSVTAAVPSGKIYVTVPNANGNPVQWAPLAGQNFANVNEVPPDGDTSYVSSATVGQVDQYQHPAIVPAGASIAAYQHVLDGRVDSGTSPTVASDIAGSVATGKQFTTSYLMYVNPQDGDPGAFPVNAGPKVTA